MKKSQAFSLIEILVVVAIMAIIATTTFPRMLKQGSDTKFPHVLGELNNLAFYARQEAILQRKVFRLSFQVNTQTPDVIVIESEEKDKEKPGKTIFKPYEGLGFQAKYELPKEIKINAVYQQGKEQLELNKGKVAYCYIIPDGIMEDLLVRMTRTFDKDEEKASFKIRPFLGNFEFFESWIKPEKS